MMNSKFIAIRQQALDELNLEYFSKPNNWDELVQKRIYDLTVKKCIQVCKNGYAGEFTICGINQCISDLKQYFGVK